VAGMLIPAVARADPTPPPAVAAAVPPEVVEIVTGGGWRDGAASGFYRTVTIEADTNGTERTLVFLQWVGRRTASGPVEVIASRALAEFNDKNHASATVVIESDDDGNGRIEVSAPDEGDEPENAVTVIATTPGHYRVARSADSAAVK